VLARALHDGLRDGRLGHDGRPIVVAVLCLQPVG
jgi:hypothetical protein